MYFWTGPDGITIVEVQYGEEFSEARLRENLPVEIIEKKLYRVQKSTHSRCPTCNCPCNKYKGDKSVKSGQNFTNKT